MTAAKQEQLVNGSIATTLSGNITNIATTLTVASSSGFPTDGNFRVRIGDEILLVTAVSGTTWTVTRGINSTAAAHNTGATVTFYLFASSFGGMQKDMYSTGYYVDRPTAGKPGAIYCSYDSMMLSRYNGSAWDEYGPFHGIVPPGPAFGSNYTWVNQGGATFTQRGMSWIFKTPAETAQPQRFVAKALPSVPYFIEVGIRFSVVPVNFTDLGFVWYDGTKLTVGGFGYTTASGRGFCEFVGKYTDVNTYSAAYNTTNVPTLSQLNYPQYFRFCDDGTNRFCQTSQNRRDWLVMPGSVVGRTNFMTPTQIGFGGGSGNNFVNSMEIFHYIEFH